MAGAARIGSLHVMLGLDSAEFTAGLQKATSGLGQFSKMAAVGIAAAAAAGAAAMVGLADAVQNSINYFDDMSKTAQKIGLTVEQLTQLKYAADLSDVSIGTLQGAMQKLSRNMADAATNAKGSAAQAFHTLGISATDATGKLRSSQDVLYELADRFAKMPDGATKTALAIATLGKSGAEMIPMLNGGAEALRQMADESDRFGQTVSTKAAHAAETFNDNMTRLQSMLGGVINQIAEGILPALADLSTRFVNAAENSGILQAASGALIWVLKQIAKAAIYVSGLVQTMGTIFAATAQAVIHAQLGQWGQAAYDLAGGIKMTTEQVANMNTEMAKIDFGISSDVPADLTAVSTDLEEITLHGTGAAGAMEKAAKAYAGLVRDAQQRINASALEAQSLGMSEEATNRLAYAQDLFNKAADRGIKLTGGQRDELNSLAASMAATEEQTRRLTDIYETGKGVFGSFFSDLRAGLKDGQSLWASLGDAASKALDSIASKALEMAANGIWDMIFSGLASSFGGAGALGNGIGAGAGSFGNFSKMMSFAGGGYTGLGSRTGGIDGIGGFPAILHPNETVVDHAMSGGGSGGRVRIELGSGLVASILDQAAAQSVEVVRSYDSNLGAIVSEKKRRATSGFGSI